ncbi:MAG: hypothetical protein ACRD3G_13320 [Vicinamibacterales bacterium]
MSQALTGGCSGTRLFFFSSKIAKTTKVTKVVFVAAFVGVLAATGCSSKPPLANTSGSPEALARAVLDAFEARDRTRLQDLALSEEEFANHVWPSLPAARPERNLPLSYVWGDLRQKSNLALTNTLTAHGGKRYELLDVSFDDVTPYAGYRVHRQSTFRVRDTSGAEAEIRVCGSMMEKDGRWKVFSYVVD